MFGVHVYLHWSIRALAEQFFPNARHDRTDWKASDGLRSELAGTMMKYKAVLVYYKADWPELCERFALPTWASSLRPCFSCVASGDELYETAGVSSESLPFHENTDEEYHDACTRPRAWVSV